MANGDDLKKLQDENKTLKDTMAALTSEKGRIETEKAIAEAQRAALLAQLPQTETKALDGKVTVDASVVTGIQNLAYKAMSGLVKKMAEAIKEAKPGLKTIILYNEQDLTALANYRTVRNELGLLNEGYRSALGKEHTVESPELPESAAVVPMAALPLFAPVVAGAAVKSVIDLLALFRTDVDIKGAAVTFDDASLVAVVAKHLRTEYKPADFEVIYSALSVPGLLIAPDYNSSELLNDFRKTAILRQEAGIAVASFDAKDANAKTNDPDKEKIAQLKALNAEYDQLLTGTGQLDGKTDISALTILLKGELLIRKMGNAESAVLLVKATGGGENMTTRNLFTGGKMFHSGTSILTYLLFTNNGELALSDVLAKTTPFKKAEFK